MNNNISDIRKIYEYFENATPVRYDCGNICGKKCCKGDKKDGMLLFPGEEELFSCNENFTVYFDERYESNAVICKGPCARNDRPLSCRIFPYFIYSNASDNKLTPAPDIRALDYCPLITEKYEFDRKFLRSLRISALKLSMNRDMVSFIEKITKKLTDFNGLGD